MATYVDHTGFHFYCDHCVRDSSIVTTQRNTDAVLPLFLHSFAEANSFSQMYGVLLMPVAIAFCAYSLWMYMKRAAMIRRKDPGPCKLALAL